MPTNSEIEYELTGSHSSFESTVGIDDEYTNRDAIVEFTLLGDGKELWEEWSSE